jgi:hypothetical protein
MSLSVFPLFQTGLFLLGGCFCLGGRGFLASLGGSFSGHLNSPFSNIEQADKVRPALGMFKF